MFYELEAVLLVNKNIGSTVEVLTIGLKEYKPTKIIEEKTTGGLLSAQQFKLDNNIMLYVPVNDFVSYGGYRVDKKGVKPDIKTKKGKELEKIHQQIVVERGFRYFVLCRWGVVYK